MDIQSLFHQITNEPLTALAIICNLILIESLLSVDNAAVVATMVLDLSPGQRGRALRYGIFGAYIFRGIALFFASFLIQIWWLKPLGGLYLVYLCIKHFIKKMKQQPEHDAIDKNRNWFYRKAVKLLGPLWATVLMVETMDMIFSIDNVFAAVAFTRNIILVWVGVFIGILAMRLVAQVFVKLMERFPFLENAAFIVLGVLGLKLCASLAAYCAPQAAISKMLESESADWATSLLTIMIFLLPVATSLLFNMPARHKK